VAAKTKSPAKAKGDHTPGPNGCPSGRLLVNGKAWCPEHAPRTAHRNCSHTHTHSTPDGAVRCAWCWTEIGEN
jgi:hypothetical protein